MCWSSPGCPGRQVRTSESITRYRARAQVLPGPRYRSGNVAPRATRHAHSAQPSHSPRRTTLRYSTHAFAPHLHANSTPHDSQPSKLSKALLPILLFFNITSIIQILVWKLLIEVNQLTPTCFSKQRLLMQDIPIITDFGRRTNYETKADDAVK